MVLPTCASIVLCHPILASILCCGGRRQRRNKNVYFTGQDSDEIPSALIQGLKECTGGRIGDAPDGVGQRWAARPVRRRGIAQRSSASSVWVALGPRPGRFLLALGL